MVRELWSIRKTYNSSKNESAWPNDGNLQNAGDIMTADEVLLELAKRQMKLEDQAGQISSTMGDLSLCREKRHEFRKSLEVLVHSGTFR